jgi:hypothetical protein
MTFSLVVSLFEIRKANNREDSGERGGASAVAKQTRLRVPKLNVTRIYSVFGNQMISRFISKHEILGNALKTLDNALTNRLF